MTYLNICGFETGDAGECATTSGTVSVQGTTKRTGAYALQVNVAGATGYVTMRGVAADGTAQNFTSANQYMTCYIRFGTLPSSSSRIVEINSGASTASVKVDSAGLVSYGAIDSEASIGVTILTGQWYRLEVRKSSTASSDECKVDGVGVTGVSTNTTISTEWRFGINNTGTANIYIDDIGIDDTAYPGIGEVRVLKANGAGALAGWLTNGSHTDVDDFPHDSDTTYARDSSAGNNWSKAMESSATGAVVGDIGAVKAVLIARDEGTAVANLKTGIYSSTEGGSATRSANAANMTTSYLGYAHIMSTWGGTAWDTASLDNCEVWATNEPTSGTGEVRVTQASLMVWCVGTPPVVPADLVLGVIAGLSNATLALRAPSIMSLGTVPGLSNATLAVGARPYLSMRADGLSGATLAVRSRALLAVLAAGLSTATLTVRSPAILALAPAAGLSGATLALRANAVLTLAAAAGLSTATVVVDTPGSGLLTLSPAAGVATATMFLRSRVLLQLAADGVALSTLTLGAPSLVLLDLVAGVASAGMVLRTPARLLFVPAEGVAEALLGLSSPAMLAVLAQGVGEARMILLTGGVRHGRTPPAGFGMRIPEPPPAGSAIYLLRPPFGGARPSRRPPAGG